MFSVHGAMQLAQLLPVISVKNRNPAALFLCRPLFLSTRLSLSSNIRRRVLPYLARNARGPPPLSAQKCCLFLKPVRNLNKLERESYFISEMADDFDRQTWASVKLRLQIIETAAPLTIVETSKLLRERAGENRI